MALKKKKQNDGGVPEWIVTYGDMMTLLLCFFILLAVFSELKKPEEYKEVIRAIQEKFGFNGGAGVIPSDNVPVTSLIERIEAVALHKEKFKNISSADDPGVTGKQTTVQRIREGLQFTIGGKLAFDAGSATLKEEAAAELQKVARTLLGKNNKIEIRGHAANQDLPPDSPYATLWDLSYARALTVKTLLCNPANGIRPERIRLVACANHEPLRSRAYDPQSIAYNRRVEIIATEALMQQFTDGETSATLSAVESDTQEMAIP